MSEKKLTVHVDCRDRPRKKCPECGYTVVEGLHESYCPHPPHNERGGKYQAQRG